VLVVPILGRLLTNTYELYISDRDSGEKRWRFCDLGKFPARRNALESTAGSIKSANIAGLATNVHRP